MNSLRSRLFTAAWWGGGTGLFFFLWALGARATGRIDAEFATAELAARYVGLSLAVFLGMGLLAPFLTRHWAAAAYAGVFGLVFTALAVSLLNGVGWEWALIGSVFTVPLASFFFAKDVRSGAITLCGGPAGDEELGGEEVG